MAPKKGQVRAMNKLGKDYEEKAIDFLKQKGLIILEQNFSSRSGEIDVIAQHGDHLVFVEVRARSHAGFAGAAASVTRKKQQKIILTAQAYLQMNKQHSHSPCRFDVIAFEPPQFGAGTQWIQGAFTT
jgi:putative endonuclease